MKTKNEKELASIIVLLLSQDYESVMLGISLFSSHYLITNYPKYKKFKVSLKYKGYHAPSQYCTTYSSKDAEFNRDQFLKMLFSKKVDVRKKTCAIINFIYNNVDPTYIDRNSRIKNPNKSNSLSRYLWGSSLDNFTADVVKPCIYQTSRSTQRPMSKKDEKRILLNNRFSCFSTTNYFEVTKDLADEFDDLEIKYNYNDTTPWSLIANYKRYLANKFKNKGKKCIKSIAELRELISTNSFDPSLYYFIEDIFSNNNTK